MVFGRQVCVKASLRVEEKSVFPWFVSNKREQSLRESVEEWNGSNNQKLEGEAEVVK